MEKKIDYLSNIHTPKLRKTSVPGSFASFTIPPEIFGQSPATIVSEEYDIKNWSFGNGLNVVSDFRKNTISVDRDYIGSLSGSWSETVGSNTFSFQSNPQNIVQFSLAQNISGSFEFSIDFGWSEIVFKMFSDVPSGPTFFSADTYSLKVYYPEDGQPTIFDTQRDRTNSSDEQTVVVSFENNAGTFVLLNEGTTTKRTIVCQYTKTRID